MTTEAQLWQRIKPQIVKAGGLPVRIENAAAMSVPDVAIVLRSTTVWVELKQLDGHQVHVPPFQYAFARTLAQTVRPELFWMMAMHGKNMVAWPMQDVLATAREGNSFYMIYSVKTLTPHVVVDWPRWLNAIENGTLLEEREDTYGYPV